MASASLSLCSRRLHHRVVLRTATIGFAVVGITTGNIMPSTPATRTSSSVSAGAEILRRSHSTSSSAGLGPEVAQRYDLLERHDISPDTCLLRFGLPREILGSDPSLPTCIKVTMPEGTHVLEDGSGNPSPALSKSYSPISHPSTKNVFDLLVKGYPYQEGGGVGAYLCSLTPRTTDECAADEDDNSCDNKHDNEKTSILASLKSPRKMHGSPVLLNRWKHVGLIAGGTGIAPLFQLATMLLQDDSGFTQDISLLFVNRREEDVLLMEEMDALVKSSNGRFRVTYSLTGDHNDGSSFEHGRGTVKMLQKALPPTSNDDDTMIFVCGMDGFVDFWGGPVGRAPRKADGSKGAKIQGPLLGLLSDAGYKETEVFKY